MHIDDTSIDMADGIAEAAEIDTSMAERAGMN